MREIFATTRIYKVFATFFGSLMAIWAYTASGAEPWPPALHPNPAVQPPEWDWQLVTPVRLNPDSNIKIYNIDMFDNEDSGAVEMLHAHGKRVICYISVGSWEDWRDDAADFPRSILGVTYTGYPDERWLDIRDVNPKKSKTGMKLAQILLKRFQRAQEMGCDAVEPDNMDGYDTSSHESTGFPLTYEDQIYFNLWLADAVQGLGMAVALKNNVGQARDPRIYTTFDFVVSEQCFQYKECDAFSEFLALNKPVFEAEYSLSPSKFCPKAKASRISAIKKRTSLNASRADCSAYY